METNSISGKRYLVTGAAGTVGRSVSARLMAEGANLILGEYDVDHGKKLADELKLSYPTQECTFCELDVTNEGSVRDCLDDCFSSVPVSGIVNAAYPLTKSWGKKLEDLSLAEIYDHVGIQLGATIYLAKTASLKFAEIGGGSIVLISSIQGVNAPKFEHYNGTTMTSPIEYTAAKAGIIRITNYLAKLFGKQGVNVNCVSPGGIYTNQAESFVKGYRESCLQKGLLDAEDLNGALLFLLSNESKFMNGQNLIVDDGWTL